MKQILLATSLIVLPVAAFTAFNLWQAPAVQAAQATEAVAPSLGDLGAIATIVTDVQTIAATGDLVAAEKRITDFETLWDDNAATMRPLNGTAWGNVDQAADLALKALRAATPDGAKVTETLAALTSALADPNQSSGAATGGVVQVVGVAVTDAAGRALPCETMLARVKDALATTTLTGADLTSATGFQTKALERCNADDDTHADEFSAQALALLLTNKG